MEKARSKGEFFAVSVEAIDQIAAQGASDARRGTLLRGCLSSLRA